MMPTSILGCLTSQARSSGFSLNFFSPDLKYCFCGSGIHRASILATSLVEIAFDVFFQDASMKCSFIEGLWGAIKFALQPEANQNP